MPKAVSFDRYGHVDVLDVKDVERPALNLVRGASPLENRILVRTIAAGINPGEIAICEGLLDKQFPTTFPSGQGTDFAGVVAELGADVTSPNVGKRSRRCCRSSTWRNYLVIRCLRRGRFASRSVVAADWSHRHRHCWKVAS
jgi:NADPH:quinone reductase-like Zn-dependent oxidoreductase